MTREQLLYKVEQAWRAFNESYARLPEAEMVEPGVTGAWSVKDLVAHVTTWEEEALKHLPHIMEGKRPPRYSVTHGGIDAFNALKSDEARRMSLAEVLERRDDTHQRLIDYLRGVPDELFATETRFRRRVRLDTYSHYPIHTRGILVWRAARQES